MQTDEEFLAAATQRGTTTFHPGCTCRMGPADSTWAVVDDQLRVHGLQGLRVIDASIMPRMISANLNASTMMIADKASDLIRAAGCRRRWSNREGAILNAKQVADDPFHLKVVRRQIVRAGPFKCCGMAVADMSCGKQPNHRAARRPSGDDATCTVFDDNAFARRHSDFGRCVQENVRMRLASCDVGSAEHPPVKQGRHFQNLKTEGEPVW